MISNPFSNPLLPSDSSMEDVLSLQTYDESEAFSFVTNACCTDTCSTNTCKSGDVPGTTSCSTSGCTTTGCSCNPT